jgi:hypothetical protein
LVRNGAALALAAIALGLSAPAASGETYTVVWDGGRVRACDEIVDVYGRDRITKTETLVKAVWQGAFAIGESTGKTYRVVGAYNSLADIDTSRVVC